MIIIIALAIAAAAFLLFCMKRKKPSGAAAAMLIGAAELLTAYIIGISTGLYTINVNLFTTAAAVVLGLPFVLLYVLFVIT